MQALRSGADGVQIMAEPQSRAGRMAKQRIYEQATQLEGSGFGHDSRPGLERRMRKRDDKGAGPPFTVAPRWAQDRP